MQAKTILLLLLVMGLVNADYAKGNVYFQSGALVTGIGAIMWVYPTNPEGAINDTHWIYANVTYVGTIPTYQTLIVDLINETITCNSVNCYRNRTNLKRGWHSIQVYLSNAGGENWSEVRHIFLNITNEQPLNIILPDEQQAGLNETVYMMGGLVLSLIAFILYKRRKKDNPSAEDSEIL